MFATVALIAGITQLPLAPVAVTPAVAAKLREIAFQAAREGDTDTLKGYFATGMPVNGTNDRGDTLLIVAAYNGQPKAVAVILSHPKVDVDARNKMGLTALVAAAFKGEIEIAESLVAAKADVNAANARGQTALMFAALTGRTNTVEYLIARGADPKAADRDGNTPLRLAETQGADGTVAVLKAALAKK